MLLQYLGYFEYVVAIGLFACYARYILTRTDAQMRSISDNIKISGFEDAGSFALEPSQTVVGSVGSAFDGPAFGGPEYTDTSSLEAIVALHGV